MSQVPIMLTTMETFAAPGPHRRMPAREARTRFTQLLALLELDPHITLITRDGDDRPIAALCPPAVVDTLDAARAAIAGRANTAAGWERRYTALRDELTARERSAVAAVTADLVATWTILDRLSPPGRDRAVDELRAAHSRRLADPDTRR